MSIPSYRRNRDGSTTITFYGDAPLHFGAMGVEYMQVRKCSVSRVLRRGGSTKGYLLTCGHGVMEPTRPRFCSKCGARVVA